MLPRGMFFVSALPKQGVKSEKSLKNQGFSIAKSEIM